MSRLRRHGAGGSPDEEPLGGAADAAASEGRSGSNTGYLTLPGKERPGGVLQLGQLNGRPEAPPKLGP